MLGLIRLQCLQDSTAHRFAADRIARCGSQQRFSVCWKSKQPLCEILLPAVTVMPQGEICVAVLAGLDWSFAWMLPQTALHMILQWHGFRRSCVRTATGAGQMQRHKKLSQQWQTFARKQIMRRLSVARSAMSIEGPTGP